MSDKHNIRRNKTALLLVLLAVVTVALSALLTTASAAAAGESPVQQEPTGTTTGTPGGGQQLQLPTATPTLLGGPTATASATPTITPVMAEIIGDPTNLRTGPGINFDIVAELAPGEELPIVGRWLGFDWYQVEWPDAAGGIAWVYAPLVIPRGDLTTVPAVDPPAAPTVDPAVAAAEETATVLMQTPGAVETATASAFSAQNGVFTATPAGGEAVAGVLPTFTPPPPYVQPEELGVPETSQPDETAVPPAVIIVSMAAMGALMLVLGVLRRIF